MFGAAAAAVQADSAAAPPPAASQGDARGGSSGSSHSAEQPKPAECRDAVGRRRAALSQDLARLGRRGPPAALARPLPTRSAESTKRSTSAVGGRRVWSHHVASVAWLTMFIVSAPAQRARTSEVRPASCRWRCNSVSFPPWSFFLRVSFYLVTPHPILTPE